MSHYARIGLDERRDKRIAARRHEKAKWMKSLRQVQLDQLAARAAAEQDAREARRREIQELVKQARLKP